MSYDENRIYEIPMSEIFADETFNVRGHIDPVSVVELAKDIQARGLDSPITLQPWDQEYGKKFRILAGHRRFKAHQLIPGLTGIKETVIPGTSTPGTIRAIIKNSISEFDARIINLTENIQRENLNIVQEARGIDFFHKAGWGEQKVANKIGKSRGWVQIRFMVLELPEEIQKEAAAGLFSQQQIRDMTQLGSYDLQMAYVRKVKDRTILGRKKEVTANSVKPKNLKKARTPEEIFAMQDIIRDLNNGDNNIITRLLGWAAGVVSDLDVHKSIADWASKHGKMYFIPEGLEGTHATSVSKEALLKS